MYFDTRLATYSWWIFKAKNSDLDDINVLTLNVRGPSYLGVNNLVNIVAADALAPYVTRTSASMILTM